MCYACMMRTMNDGQGQQTVTTSQESNSLPVFSTDQIADQLTNGYWGGPSYKFDVGVGDTLIVDLAGLSQSGQ